eukprot:g36374.t1
MQKEILSILGLPRRPKPLLSVKRSSSAPVFMLDLYRTMANEESDRWQGASLPFHVFQNTRRPLEETFLSQADTIMSFVNVGTRGPAGQGFAEAEHPLLPGVAKEPQQTGLVQ